MKLYNGSCHCGAVKFSFKHKEISEGLRCNCSICIRKGALMTSFVLAANEITINVQNDSLATYEFSSGIAKHHFCRHCGIYTFHQTLRKPGHYRMNIGCIEGIDPFCLRTEVFDGAAL